MSKKISRILTLVLAIISVFISIGVVHIFHGCLGMHDGGFMRCHWAQQSIMVTSAILAVIYMVAFFIKDLNIRLGMLLSSFAFCVLIILLANNTVILLCMSPDMHCRLAMQPVSILLSGLLIVINAIASFITNKARRE